MISLTTENMSKYVGGQIEIIEISRHRGRINKIKIEPEVGSKQNALLVEFDCLYQWNSNEGYKPIENKPYLLSLLTCEVYDIGKGRLCINSQILRKTVVFFPPDHNKFLLPDGKIEVK